jgi:hypothetical protein
MYLKRPDLYITPIDFLDKMSNSTFTGSDVVIISTTIMNLIINALMAIRFFNLQSQCSREFCFFETNVESKAKAQDDNLNTIIILPIEEEIQKEKEIEDVSHKK